MIDIKEILKGKIVFIGMGNELKGDDACGPLLIDKLKNKLSGVFINAGTAPENYIGKIIKEKPDTIILVDAVDLGKLPGAYDIMTDDDIERRGFSTHDLSPAMVMEFLKNETAARIYMLGIQPKTVRLGDSVSLEVEKSMDEIVRLIEKDLEVGHARNAFN